MTKGLSIATVSKLGNEAAELINGNLARLKRRPPMGVEFEKIYCPFLLVAKKNYAAQKWDPPSKEDREAAAKLGQSAPYKLSPKIDTKGMRNVRRDTCLLVKELLDDTLRLVIQEGRVQQALDNVCATISKLLQGQIDTSKLVISKGLRKDEYAGKTIQGEFWKKLRQRDEAAAPRVGDRLTYVVLQDIKVRAAAPRFL